jgi:hypothetical protein
LCRYARADKVIHGIVARKGTGGGHPSYAGGQIPLKDATHKTRQRLEKTILNRFLKQVVKDSAPKQPLIQEPRNKSNFLADFYFTFFLRYFMMLLCPETAYLMKRLI